MNETKPKLRWWQFSVWKFILLVTLSSVLAVAFWRVREWGRRLDDKRIMLWVDAQTSYLRRSLRERNPYTTNMEMWAARHQPLGITAADQQLAAFDNRYWLPLKMYWFTGGTKWSSNK